VEAAELQLLPPPNRARPLQSLSVDELAGLHREHGEHASVCRWLHEELRQRPRSKTELLRAALEASLAEQPAARPEPEAHKPAAVVVRCGCCQTRLRIRHHGAPVELVCPSCQSEYAVSWQDSVCVIQTLAAPVDEEGDAGPDDEHLHAAPEHVTDPWAVLGLQPGTAWAEVERARRALLQQYHPDRLGHVPPLVRQLAEGAFKRVGDAFETLKARR
jgi:DnaJ-domain-containing protein 1